MQSPLMTALAALLFVGAVAVFGTTVVHAVLYAPENSGPRAVASTAPASAATSSLPVRLIIPALNINAAVQQVGINSKGNMGVPSNFTDVAWYEGGTVPGAVGSAVIDGHVDNGLGLDGVFKHLADIKVGDEVDVQDKNGTMLHFVVGDIQEYPYEQVPTDKIFNQHDQARLNLITCEGAWVAGGKTYDHRLVVFAVLKS